MDLLQQLGIDWRLLIGQIINFIILLLVLNHFLYQPILKLLKEREEKIKKSLTDSQHIEEEMLAMEKQKVKTIQQANVEAQQIIKEAKSKAEGQREEIVLVARQEAEKIIHDAKIKTDNLSRKVQQEIIEDLIDVVIAATEKVIAKKITKKADQALIKDAIQSLMSSQ
jgi:F-type H+-transporting ATPase subunit b